MTWKLWRRTYFCCSKYACSSSGVSALKQMLHRDLCPFTVTPAAAVLSRCVSRGALTQVTVNIPQFKNLRRRPHCPSFCPSSGALRLCYDEAESQFLSTAAGSRTANRNAETAGWGALQRPITSFYLYSRETFTLVVTHLLQLQLKLELLKLEKKSADVTHKFHLSECCFDATVSDHVIGQCWRRVFCSSEVPGVADALHSSTEPPEEPEQSEAETVEASGSNQPAHPGWPAQVANPWLIISVFLKCENPGRFTLILILCCLSSFWWQELFWSTERSYTVMICLLELHVYSTITIVFNKVLIVS